MRRLSGFFLNHACLPNFAWNCANMPCVFMSTYNEMTSGGKLRGISLVFSHRALSLVHVQDMGQRGCLGLLLSTRSKTEEIHRKKVHLLKNLLTYPILLSHSGNNQRVEYSWTWTRLSVVNLFARFSAAGQAFSFPFQASHVAVEVTATEL